MFGTRSSLRLVLLSLALAAVACGRCSDTTLVEPETEAEAPASIEEGVRMIPVEDGRFKVWTKRVGSGETKVLLLHGGPGASHDYLKNFADHLPAAGYELSST